MLGVIKRYSARNRSKARDEARTLNRRGGAPRTAGICSWDSKRRLRPKRVKLAMSTKNEAFIAPRRPRQWWIRFAHPALWLVRQIRQQRQPSPPQLFGFTVPGCNLETSKLPLTAIGARR